MQNIPFHPLTEIFPLIQGKEYSELKQDILANGIREPIWIYQEQILDGRNRYRAALDAGVSPEFRDYEGDDPLGFVVSLNLHRRHLTEAQRAMVAAKLANMTNGGDRVSDQSANLHSAVSAAKAGEMLNVSERSVKTAKAIQRDGDETLQQAVTEGRVSLHAAADLAKVPKEEQKQIVAMGEKEILQKAKEIRAEQVKARRTERAQLAEELSAKAQMLTGQKKYRVIYADPPWSYGDTRAGLSNYSAAEDHYPSMSIKELCEMPVVDLALDDAVLFLWVTSPLLYEAAPIIDAWGFKYKASFVWDKVAHNVGHYNSVRHEFLLICTRGSCTPDCGTLHDSVVEHERSKKHSEKPEAFRQLIDQMYHYGPKIELFRRGAAPEGWDIWGNQADEQQAV